MGRQHEGLRRAAGSARAAAGGGHAGLRRRARLLRRRGHHQHLPGDADAPSRRANRQLLPRREGGREGVHRPGRGAPGAVRLPGCGRNRQCTHLPRRAARPSRPRGAGRDIAVRRPGVPHADRPSGLGQPRGAPADGGLAQPGPVGRRGDAGRDLPLRRRARDCAGPVPARESAQRRAGRCAPRRSCSPPPAGRA